MDHAAAPLSVGEILALLANGELAVQGMLPWSSNYALLVQVSADERSMPAVYKPQLGEAPLWDFPDGTLCRREFAAFLLSDDLGWMLVPPTVLREGPYGIGTIQAYIANDDDAHLLTMRDEGGYEAELARIAAFDVIANNADRKSGHCLKGSDGRLWSIDHGICFHAEPKLRTVLWDFAGQRVPDDVLADLVALRERIAARGPLLRAFETLLDAAEVQAFRQRLDRLIDRGTYPRPISRRSVPWPPI
ncbi:MAG: SCO1664 family protein [Chloroflexi bacterium]|jgi:uncharacterized repeat protein (TIGR03843 family)|nr:SCO1664 family protein [Chloroflexota bacterium]